MNLILTADRHATGTAGSPPLFQMQSSRLSSARLLEGRLLACLAEGPACGAILDQALAVAKGLDLSIAAGHVIETPRHASTPADPIEWQVRRRECLERFDRMPALSKAGDRVVLIGAAADELSGWARENGATLLVLGTHDRGNHSTGLGATAQRLMEHAACSLLLVPDGGSDRLPYRRLLVPLDGSVRAESVLPIAIRIARAHGAELDLAHVVTRPESLDLGCDDGTARSLSRRLTRRNEESARDYLAALEARIWKERLPVRASVVSEGDPRVELLGLAQQADLVVLASHGRSGMADVPCGSVTEYLATHAPAPLLIVRPNFAHVFAEPEPCLGQQVSSATPERA